MNWQAVFFDFDGVILDSVDVKTRAFANMFQKYGPEVEKAVVQYHLNNGGVSRFDKFRYYYETILQKKIDEKKIEMLSEQFSELVVEEVLASPFIPGAETCLADLKKQKISCYVVSGTPHEEINLIVEKKGLSEYFKEIHGSPRKKWEICRDIIQKENYDTRKCLFLGDAMSDYEAAKKTGMNFLGIVPAGDKSIFPQGTIISSSVTVKITNINGRI